MFRQLYGHRPGFELRSDEFWPDEKLLQHQVNLYVGPRAGLEVHYRQPAGAADGVVSVRIRGRLERRVQMGAALSGLAVAVLTFLVVAVVGIHEGWFTRSSRILAEPHFHGGSFLLTTILSALGTGLVTTAVAWPASWVCRPLGRAANRAEDLVTPDALLARLSECAGHE